MKYDDSHLPELKLKGTAHVGTAVTYSFVFDMYGGWANFTINDSTGEFNVNSDWGSWCYRWHTNSLGENTRLTQFLLQCDADYIVRKFAVDGTSDLKDTVDDEETLKAIRTHICEARRTRDIDKGVARAYWCEAETFVENSCNIDNMDLDLYRFLDAPWEYIATKKSHRYMLLTRRLIPFFKAWMKNHLTNGDSPMPGQATL